MVKPWIIAHRGASGKAPENTMAAFEAAIQEGVDMIELDVRFSRDGIAMVIHDEHLERTTSGHGAVAECDSRQLAGLDAGSWFGPGFQGNPVPSLQQVLERVRETELELLVEVKPESLPDGFERMVQDRVVESEMEARVILQSFDHDAVRRMRSAGAIRTAALVEHRRPDPIARTRATGSQMLAIKWWLLADALMRRAREAELQVVVWTVNHGWQIRRMIQLEVDGIISNYPDRVREVWDSLETGER